MIKALFKLIYVCLLYVLVRIVSSINYTATSLLWRIDKHHRKFQQPIHDWKAQGLPPSHDLPSTYYNGA